MQVRSIDDVLSMGQQLQVKVMGHDAKGQLQVSHKALTAAPFVDETDRPPFPRRSGDGPSRHQRPRPRIPQGA